MPSFSPYNLSAQFARSALQPDDSGYAGNRTQSDVDIAIKLEEDDDSPAATHRSRVMEEEGDKDEDEDGLSENSFEDSISTTQDGFVEPDRLENMDKPIRSIEDHDESLFNVDASTSLRGGNQVQGSADDAEEERDKSLSDDDDDDEDDDEDDDGEDDDDEDDSEPEIDMDEYYESEDDFEAEYDVDNKDMIGYRVERTKVKGLVTWPQEVARAHKTLALRGAYSLMPSSWAWDLIDHPFAEGLFAPMDSDKKLIFQERSNRSSAIRALRDLFELHIRICAYRQDGLHDQIANLIEKAIRAYSVSVEKDAKLRGYYDYVSPIFIVKYSKLKRVSGGERDALGKWVHQQALQACQERVEQYHADWADRMVDSYPRFLYTFVIIQQTVLIWAFDTDVEAPPDPYVLASLDMSKRTAWLETSLAIAITLHLAKEAICEHTHGYPRVEEEEDDPDA